MSSPTPTVSFIASIATSSLRIVNVYSGDEISSMLQSVLSVFILTLYVPVSMSTKLIAPATYSGAVIVPPTVLSPTYIVVPRAASKFVRACPSIVSITTPSGSVSSILNCANGIFPPPKFSSALNTISALVGTLFPTMESCASLFNSMSPVILASFTNM